jgi:protein-disulfide isomerase
MPSGKQSRRSRQVAQRRPPPVKGARVRRQASPKVLIGAAAALVAIGAIVAVVIVVTGGGSSKPPAPLPAAAQVDTLFGNIPQAGNRLGNPAAAVTMVEYIDLQCPICKAFEDQIFPSLVSKYVRAGKLQVQARPIAFIGADSQTGQLGAIAAAEQNRMFQFMQILYLNQGSENTGWLTSNEIDSAALSFGLALSQFRDAVGSSAAKNQAAQYAAQASTDKVQGTPTILAGRTGQTLKIVPTDQVSAAIDRLLK